MPLDLEILGQGIYSPRQAAKLVEGSPQEVIRWTRGSGPREPLWRAHYQTLDDTTEISFADLIELRVVRALRRFGISLQAIRFAIEYAQKQLSISRPLLSLTFKTDGGELLMEAIEQDGDLVSLSRKRPGQKVFAEIVKQSLSDVEYENGEVARWRPARAKHIVIDPDRYFGDPILDSYGVSTEMLFDEFEEFENKKYLSKIYEIPIDTLNDALQFEARLRRIQNQRRDG